MPKEDELVARLRKQTEVAHNSFITCFNRLLFAKLNDTRLPDFTPEERALAAEVVNKLLPGKDLEKATRAEMIAEIALLGDPGGSAKKPGQVVLMALLARKKTATSGIEAANQHRKPQNHQLGRIIASIFLVAITGVFFPLLFGLLQALRTKKGADIRTGCFLLCKGRESAAANSMGAAL